MKEPSAIKDQIKIIGINAGDDYIIGEVPREPYRSSKLTHTMLADGSPMRPTFSRDWYLVGSKPTKLERVVPEKKVTVAYELSDKSLISEDRPERIEVSDMEWGDWDEYDRDAINEAAKTYKKFQALYEPVVEVIPEKLELIDFEIVDELTVDKYRDPSECTYAYSKTWVDKGTVAPHYQGLSKILFPSIIHPATPCRFSSEDVYNILRAKIQKGLDRDYAKITSDYDFCFEVSKVVPVAEPYTVRTEKLNARGKRYRKPRYNTRYIKSETFKAFKMSHKKSGDSYGESKGYWIAPELIGDNTDDLREQVEYMAKDLLDQLNKPVAQCPTCKGRGTTEGEVKTP